VAGSTLQSTLSLLGLPAAAAACLPAWPCREAILLAYCQTLSWLRHQACSEWAELAGLDSEQQQQQGLWLASDAEQLSEEELLLLQQVQSHQTEQFPSFSEPLPEAPIQQQEPGSQLPNRAGSLNRNSSCPDWLQDLQLPATEAADAAGCRANVWRQHSGCSDSNMYSSAIGRGATPGAAAAAGRALQQEPTIAPDDDVLYYFRHIFSMPPFPGK
jgi:hypothetical protein